MGGRPNTPKATKEQGDEVEAEISAIQHLGWDVAVKYLADAGDPVSAEKLARNDWYRLKRALEILKVFVTKAAITVVR
jgi:tRNA dimethylallyltransferase